jgi:hypothetical protein
MSYLVAVLPYLVTKLLLVVWWSYAAIGANPRAAVDRRGRRAFLRASSYPIALYGPVQTLDFFPEDTRSPGPATYFGMESLGPRWVEPFMGESASVRGVLILCQSNDDDYACSYGGAAMSGGDGMDSSIQVPIVRYA